MKTCVRCGDSKPLDQFAWHRRTRGTRQTHCRPCQAEYRREHYLASRSRYIAMARARKEKQLDERYAWLMEFLIEHPCEDCGERDPVILEFDHVRGEKLFNISKEFGSRPWALVLAEIDKCEVVCANCHRRRTAVRGRFRRTRV